MKHNIIPLMQQCAMWCPGYCPSKNYGRFTRYLTYINLLPKNYPDP